MLTPYRREARPLISTIGDLGAAGRGALACAHLFDSRACRGRWSAVESIVVANGTVEAGSFRTAVGVFGAGGSDAC
jgi:hypothetical protein